MMTQYLEYVAISFGFLAVGMWISWVVNLFLMVWHRKPDAPLPTDGVFWSPFNVSFSPEKLTEKGRAASRRATYSMVGFLLIILVGALCGALGLLE